MKKRQSKVRGAGLLIAFAITGSLISACNGSALSASSTCSQFMAASAQDQETVVDQLATQYQKPDFATPLGQPDVPYFCASNPNVTLGHFFAQASD
jgi:hypothetical protein